MNIVNKHTQPTDIQPNIWMERLPALLRGAGVLAVLMSLYGFFIKGWEGSDDLMRFFMLFGHTIALAGIGLISGNLLKEGKGARVLIMLALISVIANFSILGSFLYAEFGGALSHGFVSAMKWDLHNESLVIILSIAVPAVLSLIIVVGFKVLARGMSGKMSLLFFVSNAVLLLPIRTPLVISILGIALAAYTLLLVIKNHRQRMESKTKEGRFALLIQFAPVAVLLVRNIWLYDDVAMLYASACVVVFIALRQFSLMLPKQDLFRTLADMVSSLVSLVFGVILIDMMLTVVDVDALFISVPAMFSAALLYELSTRAYKFSQFYRNAAVVVVTVGIFINMMFDDSSLASLIAILMGSIMLVNAYTTKHRTMLIAALLLILVAFIELTKSLWFAFDINAWAVSSTVGVLAIVGGSMLESKGFLLKQKLSQYKCKFSHWSY